MSAGSRPRAVVPEWDPRTGFGNHWPGGTEMQRLPQQPRRLMWAAAGSQRESDVMGWQGSAPAGCGQGGLWCYGWFVGYTSEGKLSNMWTYSWVESFVVVMVVGSFLDCCSCELVTVFSHDCSLSWWDSYFPCFASVFVVPLLCSLSFLSPKFHHQHFCLWAQCSLCPMAPPPSLAGWCVSGQLWRHFRPNIIATQCSFWCFLSIRLVLTLHYSPLSLSLASFRVSLFQI